MITVWPQYLDKNLSLKEGRKVSKEIAVSEPNLHDIEKALKRLNLTYNTQKERSYPGKWYEKSGRILVESDKPKLELLKDISLKLKEIKQ
jgi:signal recognition particle subunit SRP19